jgi:hypothetical protein
MATVTYPFDPTGSNPLNRITNEQHVITSTNFRDYHFFIPKLAPFFAETFSMTFLNTDGSVRNMVEGRDYYLSHHFISASRACARPVYGSITFLDTDTAGVARITYQTVGGDWTLDEQTIAEILANNLNNPRTSSWEQIVEMPVMFPVIDHQWNLVDMVGASDLVESMDNVRDALLQTSDGGLPQHIADKNNPHEVSKAQVGLSLVENYPVASFEQATAGTNNVSYMTPLRTQQLITSIGSGAVAAHANRTDNPHSVTKAQVGLGSVQNFGIATSADAMAGSSNSLYMTPAATKAALDQVSSVINSHITNQLNPHNTTKEQLILGNVQNFPLASSLEAQTGTANDRYMTPLRVKQAIDALAGGNFQSHINDSGNPHNTTKAQVGLGSVDNYATANIAESTDQSQNQRFMTPGGTHRAVMTYVGDDFILHVNDSNPHNTTKANIGLGNVDNYATATPADASAGTANDKFMTPAMTALMVGGGVDSHTSRTDNPHATTATQVGLGNVQNYPIANDTEAAAGTSNALYVTPRGVAQYVTNGIGATLTSHVDNQSNPHNTTKAQVGLGNVENFGVANDTEAVTGSITDKYITPRGLNLGATAVAQTILQSHSNRTDNPHNTTPAQIGTYTSAQIDSFIASRLSIAGTAVNSTQLEGATLSNVLQSAASTATLTANTVVAAAIEETAKQKFTKTYANDPDNTTGFVWLKIATLEKTPDPVQGPWGPTDIPNSKSDLHAFISGGEAPSSNMGGLYYLHISMHAPVNPQAQPISATLKQLSDNSSPDVQIGYTWDSANERATVFMKVVNGSHSVTVTNLNRGGITLTSENVGDVEPVDIAYIPMANLSSNALTLGGRPAADYALQADYTLLRTEHDTLRAEYDAYKVLVAQQFQNLADQIANS